MYKVLITGASGLLGSELSSYLKNNNHKVVQLSRRKSKTDYKTFAWDLNNNYLERGALENVEHIIHLAGAGIAEKRWSKKRKKEIIESRVKSAELLFNEILKLNTKPKSFISASAVGYYGASTSDKIFEENDNPGKDFVAEVCKLWETSAEQFNNIGIRTVQLRFGVVLSPAGGALKKMLLPTKLGIGSPLGSGNQYFPWIHIRDVLKIIEKACSEEKIKGIYNVVSPSEDKYRDFALTLAKVLRRPILTPNVPSLLLKLIFGDMSEIILNGSRISPKKIIDSGYDFEFNDLYNALDDLLTK